MLTTVQRRVRLVPVLGHAEGALRPLSPRLPFAVNLRKDLILVFRHP